ncbi:MAG: hypothetical protein KQH53_04125 [Desulfarculaceae bacterium]|nr:hypothetical protein [Desulfarculaceae bacterium]
MKLSRWIVFAALLAALAAYGCEGSFSVSTAELSEPKMATAVDPKTQAPTQVVSEVPPSTGPLFATAKVTAAPPGTKVKALFFYLEGERRQIAQDEITLKEGAYVSFQLSPPASGWPLGKYEVVFYLNDKEAKKLGFSVVADKTAAAPKPAPAPAPTPAPAPAPRAQQPAAPAPAPAPAVPQGYKVMSENNFGFSLQVPQSWNARLTKSKDYLISGPAGTPGGEVSLIIQIIAKSQGNTSLIDQMKRLLRQIANVPQGKILKKGEVNMAGGPAPYFLASYETKDTRGLAAEYGHAQVGLEHGGYIFLISYSAPTAVYQANLNAFQRVVDSWRFTK